MAILLGDAWLFAYLPQILNNNFPYTNDLTMSKI